MTHWSEQYLGKKFVMGGRGPDVFDCWGLLLWVRQHHFADNSLAVYPISPDIELAQIVRYMNEARQSGEWEAIKQPEHGCVALMSTNKEPYHVGLYLQLDGGVILHTTAATNAIMTHRRFMTKNGWNILSFYRNKSWSPTSLKSPILLSR